MCSLPNGEIMTPHIPRSVFLLGLAIVSHFMYQIYVFAFIRYPSSSDGELAK